MVQLEQGDENKTIWRYTDFTKFVSLLDKSALFFPRGDTLGDLFEGSHGTAYVNKMKSAFGNGEEGTWALNSLSAIYKKIVKFTFVSCWHLSEHESAAMWKLYVKSNEGIAIQSTVASLISSIKDKNHDIYVGKVEYIDFDKQIMSGGLDEGERYPFFNKRKSFEHEHELRLIIQDFKAAKNKAFMDARPPRRKGVYIPVDLDLLIKRI